MPVKYLDPNNLGHHVRQAAQFSLFAGAIDESKGYHYFLRIIRSVKFEDSLRLSPDPLAGLAAIRL